MGVNSNTTLTPPDSGWVIIYHLSQRAESFPAHAVLKSLVAITHCDAAFLYWRDPAARELRLSSAVSTWEDGRIPGLSTPFRFDAKLADAMREVEALRTQVESAKQENLARKRRLAERKIVERGQGIVAGPLWMERGGCVLSSATHEPAGAQSHGGDRAESDRRHCGQRGRARTDERIGVQRAKMGLLLPALRCAAR
jgi:hypothetical protein